jgi:flagellar hook-length control protein FliK
VIDALMTPLVAPQPANPGHAAPPAGPDAKNAFSRALDDARRPADDATPAEAAKPAPADEPPASRAQRDGDDGAADAAKRGEHRDRTDPAAPDLSALLPGWPGAALPPQAADAAREAVAAAEPRGLAAKLAAASGEDGPLPAADAAAGLADAASPAATAGSATEAAFAAHAEAAISAPDIAHPHHVSATASADAPAALWVQLPATAAAASPAAAGADAAASPFHAHLTAAIDSPDFAPSLGHTLSLLARDGVQQAQLSLHPAELGPVAVQIAVDGTQARIDFHAAHAATRAALESSLPDLAAALRDSGLTLAGGGVFDQSPQRQHAPHARPSRGTTDAADRDHAAPPAHAPSATRQRGVVDLYA